jgi:endogenous inhibitor of DNA gyrase (YacG/DUF329 family)
MNIGRFTLTEKTLNYNCPGCGQAFEDPISEIVHSSNKNFSFECPTCAFIVRGTYPSIGYRLEGEFS